MKTSSLVLIFAASTEFAVTDAVPGGRRARFYKETSPSELLGDSWRSGLGHWKGPFQDAPSGGRAPLRNHVGGLPALGKPIRRNKCQPGTPGCPLGPQKKPGRTYKAKTAEGESSSCVITKRDGSCSLGSVSKEDLYNVRVNARMGKSVLLGQLAPYAHYALQSLKKWANPIGRAVAWVDDAITDFQEAIGGKQVPIIHGNELKLAFICSLRPSNPRWPNILDRKCAERRESDRWKSLTQDQRDKETREKEEAQKRGKEAEMVLGINKVLEACDKLIDGPLQEIPDGAAQNCKELREKVLELQGLGTVDMGTFAGCKCVYPYFEPVGSHCGDICRVRLANRGLDAEEIKATGNRTEEKPEANPISNSIVEVTLEACDGAGFQGTCRNMTYTHQRCENLPTELNNTISSLRVTTGQMMGREKTVCRLFRDSDCQGKPAAVMKHTSIENMSTYSGHKHRPDNQISSIKCLLSGIPQGLLAPAIKTLTRLPPNAKRHIWIPNNLRCSRWLLVQPNEGCAEIAARAHVSLARITRWNAPGLDLCRSFVPGSYACVSTIQADGTMARDLPEFEGVVFRVHIDEDIKQT
ncbi:hypothetical protein CDD80_3120 [Ophiocordyceps camponoti-rufipedis]|uniref:LysM domain-containing protein n=1 Tax=Ophiocordyceps camponoti-rufipedis TaxID=2004952 RepID=A0A2C5XJ73_9HYPO|nr:hypothetical protein CDD80_3120 [Ophiocordyceps camponoti-rufipedis]